MLQTRVDVLRKTLIKKNLDGLIISNFYNIFYLTGFKSLTDNEREGWGLITADNVYIFSDSRYLNTENQPAIRRQENKNTGQILNISKTKIITPEKGLIKHLVEIIKEEKIQKLGFEGEDLRYGEYLMFDKHLGTELISVDKLLILQRAVKDKIEIEKLKKACLVADLCLKDTVKTLKIGQTEKEIAFRIEFWLKKKGYDKAFYPIIAIDKNSAIPHYDTKSGNGKIKHRSVILIDFGAKFQEYHSDMTRMIFVGKPTDEMLNTYKSLLYAQEKTINQLKKDNNPVSIDQYCRKLISDKQLPVYQHSTGHGVGLQIHEYPKISFTSTDILCPNQVITIEPGIYIENRWGMRIEDTVLIRKNKEVKVLTEFHKKIIIKS